MTNLAQSQQPDCPACHTSMIDQANGQWDGAYIAETIVVWIGLILLFLAIPVIGLILAAILGALHIKHLTQ